MIAIIDYGMGNLGSVRKAFMINGFEVSIINSPVKINNYSGIVLPGVGAFEDAMRNLRKAGFGSAIRDFVSSGKPFLGICLGYQLLFSESYENGVWKGLDIIEGSVIRFDISLKVPHIGWNKISIKKKTPLLDGIGEGSFFYFVHSYFPEIGNNNIVMTTTNYEITFVSGIASRNVFGVQFHPEKSQQLGIRLIKNFGGICENNTGN